MDFNAPIDLNTLKIPSISKKPISIDVEAELDTGCHVPFDFGNESAGVQEIRSDIIPKKKRVSSTTLSKITPSNLHTKTRKKKKSETVEKQEIPRYNPEKPVHKKPPTSGTEPLSLEDRKYIDDNAGAMSVDDIADHLSKKRSTVFRYMDQHNLLSQEDRRDSKIKKRIINNLRNEAFWYVIEEGYTDKEISFFEETWYGYIVQLDDDVTSTEKEQIKALIETSIRINRMTINEQRINNDIAQLDKEIQQLQEQVAYADEEDKQTLTNDIMTLLNSQGALSASKVEVAKNISTCQKDQSTLMKDLDVTRARRVEKSDMSDKTWARMLTEIRENPSLKKQMGAMAYISLLAVEKMKGQLTKDYTYADGEIHPVMMLPEGIVNQELAELVDKSYVPQDD